MRYEEEEEEEEENIDIPLPSPIPQKTPSSILTNVPQDIISSPDVIPSSPQRFEIALARKLTSRYSSSSLQNLFINKMDIDKDGYITKTDLHRTFHNLLGIDLTEMQLNVMFQRIELLGGGEKKADVDSTTASLCGTSARDETSTVSSTSSMKSFPSIDVSGSHDIDVDDNVEKVHFRDFKRYIQETADSPQFSSSASEYTVDLSQSNNNTPNTTPTSSFIQQQQPPQQQRDSILSQDGSSTIATQSSFFSSTTRSSNKRHIPILRTSDTLVSIVPPPNAVTYELRQSLRRLLQQHSNKRGGMPDTILFLSMDIHRCGKITPEEFQMSVASWGLQLSMDQVKIILGKHYKDDAKKRGIDLKEFIHFLEEMDDDHGVHAPMPWELMDTSDEKRRLIAMERAEKQYALQQRLAEKEEIAQKKEGGKGGSYKEKDDGKSNYQLASKLDEVIHQRFHTTLNAFTKYNTHRQSNNNNSRYGGVSGKLNVGELHEMMMDVGLKISEERVVKLVKKFDGDGDGMLSKGDFVRLIAYGGRSGESEEYENGQEEEVDVVVVVGSETPKRQKDEEDGAKKSAYPSPSPSSLPPPTSPAAVASTSKDGVQQQQQQQQDAPPPTTPTPLPAVSPKTPPNNNNNNSIMSQSSSLTTSSSTTTTTATEVITKSEQEVRLEANAFILKFRDQLERRCVTGKKAFEMMDVDQTKFLTVAQLKRGFKRLGIDIPDEYIHHIIKRFDPENTGEMRYYQFLKLLTSKLE